MDTLAPYDGHYSFVPWTLLPCTMDTISLYHGHYSSIRRTLLLRTMDTLALYGRHYSHSYSVHGINASISRSCARFLQNATPCPEILLFSRLPSLSVIVYIVSFPSCQVSLVQRKEYEGPHFHIGGCIRGRIFAQGAASGAAFPLMGLHQGAAFPLRGPYRGRHFH